MPVDAAQLRRLFEEELGSGLAEARTALATGDVAGVVRFAHSLAGVAPSLGHETLGDALVALELSCRAQDDAWTGAHRRQPRTWRSLPRIRSMAM